MIKIDVLIGLQWGDEGKGKIVDYLTPNYDIIARFQGGPNAGHTLEFNGIKHVLHTIPSGIFHPHTINIIGNGVIIDPVIFEREIIGLSSQNVNSRQNLLISKKAHLILPSHRLLDAFYENIKGDSKIGSTLKGIGPTYTDKTARQGLRTGDILSPDFEKKYQKLKETHIQLLSSMNFKTGDFLLDGLSFEEYENKWFKSLELIKDYSLIDSEYYINNAIEKGKKVLAEGAQGTMLDIDFGSYPFVTSSNTTTAGVCTGLGVAPNKIGRVFGIFKAYCTRVGSGPFPTELSCETGQKMRDNGNEYGSTTGRPRRCGWLDMVALKYAIMLNGVTDLFMMKADVLCDFELIKAGKSYKINGNETLEMPFDLSTTSISPVYDDLKGWTSNLSEIKNKEMFPVELINYIEYIQQSVNIPIGIISVGPDRTQTVILKEYF